ncbi:MAG: FAD-dependent monooxygenase [Burkholderiaceae bacterium]|jgi:2-polyprenyl-6-methoxyphenol hydroxylase-like FAD-dependent oxidoreductase
MGASPTGKTEVLVVGAGPTGLVLALWLIRLGVRVRIIDKTAVSAATSRALAVQARTLEFYRQIGLAEAVLAAGREVDTLNFWASGNKVARAELRNIGEGLSPYPFPLIYPQDEHEALLIETLASRGLSVERHIELLDFTDTDAGVRARLKGHDGRIELCDAAYIAGCDGAHSAVRECLQIGFLGGTYQHVFYVADVQAQGPPVDGGLHVGLDRTDFLALFPLKADGHVRLVGALKEDVPGASEGLAWNDVNRRVLDWMHLQVGQVNWFSTYRVHHRVATRFQKGHAFLLGDAAHIHSPVGGQGMNTGIGDAVNLAWKLASVLQTRGHLSLLDSYETERIAFARRLVSTTDRAFTVVTSSTPVARVIRLKLLPILFSRVLRFRAPRRFLFRTVSQIKVSYRSCELNAGRAGSVRGGDRLPYVEFCADGKDNFSRLDGLGWQAHVYGEATPALRTACLEQCCPLYTFTWQSAMSGMGLRRNALYLVRPDGYVGLADPQGSAQALSAYMAKHGIVCSKGGPWS